MSEEDVENNFVLIVKDDKYEEIMNVPPEDFEYNPSEKTLYLRFICENNQNLTEISCKYLFFNDLSGNILT